MTPRDQAQCGLRADRVEEAAHPGPKLSLFSPGSGTGSSLKYSLGF